MRSAFGFEVCAAGGRWQIGQDKNRSGKVAHGCPAIEPQALGWQASTEQLQWNCGGGEDFIVAE